jgi:hypothetical protein
MQGILNQGTKVNRMIRLFGYADDVACMSHNTAAVKELFQALEREGRICGLHIY